MQRIGVLFIILWASLSLGQDPDSFSKCLNQECQYLFALATRADVIESFVDAIQSIQVDDTNGNSVTAFELDLTRFDGANKNGILSSSNVQESLTEDMPNFLRAYLDTNNPNPNLYGFLFPLYLQFPGSTVYPDPSPDIIQQPCQALIAVVKDTNNLTGAAKQAAIDRLNEVSRTLNVSFNANVAYGPNPDGSGSGAASKTMASLEPAVPNQEIFYTYLQKPAQNNVTIAVIDTGVQKADEIEDPFPNNIPYVLSGLNVLDANRLPSDKYAYRSPPSPDPNFSKFYFHGLPVAYLASTSNTTASPGFAPQILPVKVCDNNSTDEPLDDDCKVSDIIIGVCYALHNFNPQGNEQQRLVINLSVGGEVAVDLLGQALWETMDKGAVVVASGGNLDNVSEESNERYYPAAFECRPSDKIAGGGTCLPGPSPTYDANGLIAVGSVNASGDRSGFSVQADYNDVAALGENFPAPLTNRTGTSFSAPIVSGVAAAILTQVKDATPLEVEACIRTIAQAINPLPLRSPPNDRYGSDKIGVGIVEPDKFMDLKDCSFQSTAH